MKTAIAKLRAELLALIDGTTPGPWGYSDKGTPGHFWIEPEAGYLPPPHYLCVGGAVSKANARLIAAAPTLAADTLRLLDEIERLRGQIAAIVAAYDRTFFMHTADFHSDGCGCLRCEIDRARAALAEGDDA